MDSTFNCLVLCPREGTSGSEERRVTRGGDSFLLRFVTESESWIPETGKTLEIFDFFAKTKDIITKVNIYT